MINQTRKRRTGLIFMAIVLIVVVLQSLPIFVLKNVGMKKIEGDYIELYYDAVDDHGGRMVFEQLENSVKEISDKLNLR